MLNVCFYLYFYYSVCVAQYGTVRLPPTARCQDPDDVVVTGANPNVLGIVPSLPRVIGSVRIQFAIIAFLRLMRLLWCVGDDSPEREGEHENALGTNRRRNDDVDLGVAERADDVSVKVPPFSAKTRHWRRASWG